MFSTGFNSGARAGSSTSVRLSGTTRSLARCHLARSISMTPWAPGATACATSARCRLMGAGSWVQAHGLRVASGQDQGRALTLLRADRPEDVDRVRSLVVRGAGPSSPPGPAPGNLVLLSDARLVLPPQLYGGAVGEARPDRLQDGGETFLKTSSASGSWASWRGRAESLRSPSAR